MVVVGLAFAQVFPEIGPQTRYTQAELEWQRANGQLEASGAHELDEALEREPRLEPARRRRDSSAATRRATASATPARSRSARASTLQAGESNYTEIGVETGLLGALLFVAWNVALVVALLRAGRPELAAALAAMLVVAIQTDAYGIPWLAVCLWWLAGSGRVERSPRGPDRYR